MVTDTIRGVPSMDKWAGVVLAAGKGKRMKSQLPKVLHTVCGRELVFYAVEALRGAGLARIVVVVSPETRDAVRALFGGDVEYTCQELPTGTAHALLQVSEMLSGKAEYVTVVGADSPLIRSSTLDRLRTAHVAGMCRMTILSANTRAQDGIGRVTRDEADKVIGIVEAADLSQPDGEREVEINSGGYCFDASWLWETLPRIQKAPTGEFYLTSLAAMAAAEGGNVVALMADDPEEVLGINNRVQLAQVEYAMRQRINEIWMLEGVSMLDPGSTYVDSQVELGPDTLIYPHTMILGRSKIGTGCTIGPGTVIRDSVVGEDCRIVASFLEEATLESSVEMGPFSHLRPGAYLESGVHLGNFAEIKASRLGRGVAMGHFGYVGDAEIGDNVNVGAGTVTCNYDGISKHTTVVEEGAFIGSDTMLVAPVRIGAGAATGAGSVVTKDVPPHRLAVGVPATIRERKTQSD